MSIRETDPRGVCFFPSFAHYVGEEMEPMVKYVDHWENSSIPIAAALSARKSDFVRAFAAYRLHCYLCLGSNECS